MKCSQCQKEAGTQIYSGLDYKNLCYDCLQKHTKQKAIMINAQQ
ncbi:hypothetical protein [endosymbiont GvMRE of Glomus versiforme]|nr:hypothetical protein [endosymbiont GvMRE of Glomus versiforme]RHZ36302.1 hypothetical protein GvMRE_Ic1g107 [endosymbiont GvMRE of Glomus versiforme]